jgi:hypothetical protein
LELLEILERRTVVRAPWSLRRPPKARYWELGLEKQIGREDGFKNSLDI